MSTSSPFVPRDIPFQRSPEPTIGVEWELALVDATTGNLANRVGDVLDALGAPDDAIHQELLRNTVEIVSNPHHTVAGAMDDLLGTIGRLQSVTKDSDLRLYAGGTHPFAEWSEQIVTDAEHYAELIERTRIWGRQMLIWGLHVHVGISHEAKVMPIINALLHQYPHLLALSASSPLWDSQDTGYASNRSLLFQQLPTAGLPYQFSTWSQWVAYVNDQLKSGVISPEGNMHWDIRPAPRHGTIEVRICDSPSNVVELRSLVALTQCLVAWLDERLDRGETLPRLQPWHVEENKWRAARYGLDAEIILNRTTDERLVTDDTYDLLSKLEPVARRLECEDELRGVEDIMTKGAAYQRRRADYEAAGGGAGNDVGEGDGTATAPGEERRGEPSTMSPMAAVVTRACDEMDAQRPLWS